MAKPEEKLLERTYVIPLRAFLSKSPKYKRAKKAVRIVKEFLAKHMKVPDRDLDKIKLDPWLNRALWIRGIKKPPYKVTVKATRGKDGNIKVEIVSLPPKYKVENEFLLKKKTKFEARTAEIKKKRADEEAKRKAEEEKRKAEEAKRAELAAKEKPEAEKAEEKREEEKKVEEKIMLKEMAKMETKPSPELGQLKVADGGRREKKDMKRMALEK
jgi:large subunit ribosomal protein L31e